MRFGRERGEGGVRVGADRGGLRRTGGGAPNPSRAAARPGGTGEHLVLPGLATPREPQSREYRCERQRQQETGRHQRETVETEAILSQLHLAELADGIAGSKLRQTPARYTALRKENLSV
jgi:hypothetical protein